MKPKFMNLEEALLNVPEEERDELRKTLTEQFEDFDPENPPGKPILEMSPGPNPKCPECGNALEKVSVLPCPEPPNEPVELWECDRCDQPYMRDAPN